MFLRNLVAEVSQEALFLLAGRSEASVGEQEVGVHERWDRLLTKRLPIWESRVGREAQITYERGMYRCLAGGLGACTVPKLSHTA